MICGFIVNAMGRGFEKNLISGLLRPAMAMTDCDLDGDPNIDSQNAPNSLFIPNFFLSQKTEGDFDVWSLKCPYCAIYPFKMVFNYLRGFLFTTGGGGGCAPD